MIIEYDIIHFNLLEQTLQYQSMNRPSDGRIWRLILLLHYNIFILAHRQYVAENKRALLENLGLNTCRSTMITLIFKLENQKLDTTTLIFHTWQCFRNFHKILSGFVFSSIILNTFFYQKSIEKDFSIKRFHSYTGSTQKNAKFKYKLRLIRRRIVWNKVCAIKFDLNRQIKWHYCTIIVIF